MCLIPGENCNQELDGNARSTQKEVSNLKEMLIGGVKIEMIPDPDDTTHFISNKTEHTKMPDDDINESRF